MAALLLTLLPSSREAEASQARVVELEDNMEAALAQEQRDRDTVETLQFKMETMRAEQLRLQRLVGLQPTSQTHHSSSLLHTRGNSPSLNEVHSSSLSHMRGNSPSLNEVPRRKTDWSIVTGQSVKTPQKQGLQTSIDLVARRRTGAAATPETERLMSMLASVDSAADSLAGWKFCQSANS